MKSDTKEVRRKSKRNAWFSSVSVLYTKWQTADEAVSQDVGLRRHTTAVCSTFIKMGGKMIREKVYDGVFDAQKHFRVLLDAMSRPGSIRVLDDALISPPEGFHRAAALVGFALLNGDVCFHVADGADEVAEYLVVNTTSEIASADEADFIFLNGRQRSPVVLAAKVGSLRYPEDGASLVVGVEKISDDAIQDGLELILSGPGIADTKTIYIQGLDAAILSDFVSQNVEFPIGIDLILTDEDDAIVCVPRTAKLRWE